MPHASLNITKQQKIYNILHLNQINNTSHINNVYIHALILYKCYCNNNCSFGYININFDKNLPINMHNSTSVACKDDASTNTASQNQWYAVANNSPWENQGDLILAQISYFKRTIWIIIPIINGIIVL